MTDPSATPEAGAAAPKPTMADVARRARVSKMTVSRVLAGQGDGQGAGQGAGQGVAGETRARVLAAVEALRYVPDLGAHALSTGRSGFVAALVPNISNSNFADTVRGLTDALAPARLQVLLGTTEYDDAREETLVRTLLARRPEAVVLTGDRHAPGTSEALLRAGLPVLETWERAARPLGLSVGFSNAEAAALMVRHLHARGYRRIAFLGGEPGRDHRGEARERGYLETLAALGLGPPRLVRHGTPPISMAHGMGALDALARDFPDSDAAFCVSDLSAFGVVMECHRRGWDVPGRLAVAGFGDFEVSRVCHPRITTIAVDAYALGRRTGEELLAALGARRAGRPWPARPHVALPVTIAARESA